MADKFCVLVVGLCWACSGAAPAADKAPVPAEVVPVEAVAPGPFSGFTGEHVASGATFRLAGHPIGVDGPDVVVSLLRTEWTTLQSPSGQDIREATATLVVQRGDEQREIQVGQGQARTALGATVKVIDAGEEYDKERLRYLAWVDLQVDVAE